MIHLPQDLGSKYRFITLAAQRCDQLIRGAKPRLDTGARKPTTLALQEVMAGVVEERGPEEIALEQASTETGQALAGEGGAGVPTKEMVPLSLTPVEMVGEAEKPRAEQASAD